MPTMKKKIYKRFKELKEKKIVKWILTMIFVVAVIKVVWRLKIIQWLIEKLRSDVLTVLPMLVVLIIGFIALVDVVKKQMEKIGKLNKIDDLSSDMRGFSVTLNKVTEIVNEIKEKSLQLIETTCSILKDITHLNISKRIVKKEEKLVTEGLEAVKLNYEVWSNRINETEDELLQKNWLHYLKTYFREEAFDIQRKELVTNARNYPFLLITTLLAFVKTIEHEKSNRVYFYTVTPVHPKDWYNWPHGREKPRRYFEMPFIGQYRRILREIKKWNKNKMICRGRFLLVARDKKITRQFGWELDTYIKVLGNTPYDVHLKDWQILDVPITLKYLQPWSNIYRIYGYHVENNEERFFIPLLCNKEFVYKEAAKKTFPPVDIKELKAEFDQITSSTSKFNSEVLFRSQLEKDWKELCNFIKSKNNQKLAEIKDIIERYPKNTSEVDFASYIENIQYLSLLLYEKHTLIENILLNTLRIKDFQNELSWCTLLEKYVNDLHSDDGQVGIISLQNGNNNTPFYINYWKDNDIPPEFAMFGVGTKEANIEWKIVLMTDLDYPFKVSSIKLLTCDEKDQIRKKKFEKFKLIMNTFLLSDDNLNKSDLRKQLKEKNQK